MIDADIRDKKGKFIKGHPPTKKTLYAEGRLKDLKDCVCETCKKSFKTRIRNVHRGSGRFCSFDCKPGSWTTEKAKNSVRKSHLRRMYGVTPEWFDEQIGARQGLCDICKQPESLPNRNLCVDHNHVSGKLRGLLCNSCNSGLALFKESVHSLASAIAYLEEHEGRA